MNRKLMVMSGLFLCLGFMSLAGEEAFFGEMPLRALCDRSSVIMTGAISWSEIGMAYGGKVRFPFTIRVAEVLKGSFTHAEAKARFVTPGDGGPRRDLTNGCVCVVFLDSNLQTVDPWFSIQHQDKGLVWALKQICGTAKSKKPVTTAASSATNAIK